ncbi:MAG: VanZ family protein [Ruminococcus sp.]|nr:VanZ family protein [Ruminococcus sp.]
MANENVVKICKIAFFPYIFCVLWITLINRESKDIRYNLNLFWEYREFLFGPYRLFFLNQIICNILMLMPLGFMLPVISRKVRKVKYIFVIACSFSIFIEIIQLITGRGLCEFDDVFNNTLGAIIGYFIYNKFKVKFK